MIQRGRLIFEKKYKVDKQKMYVCMYVKQYLRVYLHRAERIYSSICRVIRSIFEKQF